MQTHEVRLEPSGICLQVREDQAIVEAALEQGSPALRPGMEGVGKIAVDQRLFVAIWTRPVFEWFRLKLWSWWP